MLSSKDTNPKDAVGIRKWRVFTTVPMTVIVELGVAMLEGARKYGRHNYRVAGVRSSVYIDAAFGHIMQWWEGEDIDADSKRSHIIKAIASLAVLYDAMVQDKLVDDRPPRTRNFDAFKADLQAAVDDIFERIPEALPAYIEGDQHDTPPTDEEWLKQHAEPAKWIQTGREPTPNLLGEPGEPGGPAVAGLRRPQRMGMVCDPGPSKDFDVA